MASTAPLLRSNKQVFLALRNLNELTLNGKYFSRYQSEGFWRIVRYESGEAIWRVRYTVRQKRCLKARFGRTMRDYRDHMTFVISDIS